MKPKEKASVHGELNGWAKGNEIVLHSCFAICLANVNMAIIYIKILVTRVNVEIVSQLAIPFHGFHAST